MSEGVDELIQRVRAKHLAAAPAKRRRAAALGRGMAGRLGGLLRATVRHRKPLAIGLLVAIVLGLGAYILLEDYLTKRQAYPIRRVLYQCSETVAFSGRYTGTDGRQRDFDSKTIIQEGNQEGTKLGDILGIFKREGSDEGMQYQLEDKNKTRFAYAVEKREPLQAGLSLGGAMDFRELYAELIGRPEKYISYAFIPERGRRNRRLQVVLDAAGQRRLVNQLIALRTIPHGVLWGAQYRAGTELHEFIDTADNRAKMEAFFKLIDRYQAHTETGVDARSRMIEQMLDVVQAMASAPVYYSYEDGFFDIRPQESSTYLFARPSFGQRLRHVTGPRTPPVNTAAGQAPAGELIKLRVENIADYWPGNYWLLNRISFGEPPNVVRPFAHTNNGGYVIADSQGTVARIEIEDFILHYGDDLVYKYYLDKNGDGRIDAERELIGRVLYRVHHDDRLALAEAEAGAAAAKDVTRRFSYSFMAGYSWEERDADFYLCNTIESFIVNEINRGFGKHSDLGWINIQRSNIRLLRDRSIENLARALSPESALVAKDDIVALLRAAKRAYVAAPADQ